MKILALAVAFLLSSCSPVQEVTIPDLPASASAEEVDLAVQFPHIGFSAPVNHQSVNFLIALLTSVTDKGAKAIILEINTQGGDTNAGFKLTKAIETSSVPVICVVDHEALSMGFYILQGCKIRLMTKRSVLMAHHSYFPSISGYATMDRLLELAADLKASNRAYTEHECGRLKIPLKACRAKIARSWYLSWEEAVEVGAVDGTVKSVVDYVEAYRKAGSPPPL